MCIVIREMRHTLQVLNFPNKSEDLCVYSKNDTFLSFSLIDKKKC